MGAEIAMPEYVKRYSVSVSITEIAVSRPEGINPNYKGISLEFEVAQFKERERAELLAEYLRTRVSVREEAKKLKNKS